MPENEPQQGKIYRLIGGTDEPCIAAGNTWEESVVDPAEATKKKEEEDAQLAALGRDPQAQP